MKKLTIWAAAAALCAALAGEAAVPVWAADEEKDQSSTITYEEAANAADDCCQ